MTIKEARKARGLTQKQMSKLMEIPFSTIADWEQEKRTPPEYVKRLVIKELMSFTEEEIASVKKRD